MMLAPATPATLLCFNLRREHADANAPSVAVKLSRAQETLTHARQHGWRIAHAHTIAHESGAMSGAIAGLEPLVEEPVYTMTGRAAFAEPALAEFVRARGAGFVYMIGALYSRHGLASLLLANELGLSVNLISEACFSARHEAVAPEQINAVLRTRCVAPAGEAAEGPRYGGNVICLESQRS